MLFDDFVLWLKNNPSKAPYTAQYVARMIGNTMPVLGSSVRRNIHQLGSRWPSLVGFSYTRTFLSWADAAIELRTVTVIGRSGILPEFANQEFGGRILQVLGDAAPGGDISQLGEAGVRSIVGFRWISLDDILNAIGYGVKMVDEEALSMTAHAADAVIRKNELYEVRGISAFFATVVQRSGFEWGGRTEVRALIGMIMSGIPSFSLRMSVPMPNGRMGFDIVYYRAINGGLLVVDIFQCKALKDMGAMLAPRGSSVALKQFWSDLRRLANPMLKTGRNSFTPIPHWRWKVAARGVEILTAVSEMLPISGKYAFQLSFDHIVENVPEAAVYIQRQILKLNGEDITDIDAIKAFILDSQIGKFDPSIDGFPTPDLSQIDNLDELIQEVITDIIDNVPELKDAMVILGSVMGEQLTAAARALRDVANIDNSVKSILADYINAVGSAADDVSWSDIILTGDDAINGDTLEQTLRVLSIFQPSDRIALIEQLGASNFPLDDVAFYLNRKLAGFTEEMIADMPEMVVEFQIIYKGLNGTPGGILKAGDLE